MVPQPEQPRADPAPGGRPPPPPRRAPGALLLALVILGLAGPAGTGLASGPPPGGRHAHVVGGSTVRDDGAWAFIAVLLLPAVPDAFQAQLCAGELVAPQWVLTAAHCVTDVTDGGVVRPADLEVAVGHRDLRRLGPRDRLKVVRIVRQPHFMVFPDRSMLNDVALLRLQVPLPVEPVSLPASADGGPVSGGTVGTIAGWGRTSARDPRRYGAVLRQAAVRISADADCLTWEARVAYPIGTLCAGSPAGTPTVCTGDSGGPLVRAGPDGRPVLIGVASFGPAGCGTPGSPPVFTRVARFTDWVAATVGAPGATRAGRRAGRAGPGG